MGVSAHTELKSKLGAWRQKTQRIQMIMRCLEKTELDDGEAPGGRGGCLGGFSGEVVFRVETWSTGDQRDQPWGW